MPNEGKNYEYDVCSFYWLVRGLVKYRTFPERGEKHECQTWKKATEKAKAYYDDRTPAIEKQIKKINGSGGCFSGPVIRVL